MDLYVLPITIKDEIYLIYGTFENNEFIDNINNKINYTKTFNNEKIIDVLKYEGIVPKKDLLKFLNLFDIYHVKKYDKEKVLNSDYYLANEELNDYIFNTAILNTSFMFYYNVFKDDMKKLILKKD
ncbi:MAG: hypothetical protein IJD92_02160 [Bacilli bacterium]|nr:hypothetical protein [Bacilli bacterium]